MSALSTTTEIDFVQYQELSELFAVLTIPAGYYESVKLNLDYSDAELVIQDPDGNARTATAVDSEGNPLGAFQVSLQLDGNESMVVSPGTIANLTLDLDLSASNEIVSYSPARVVVEPFLMATATLDENREHRVRGLLDAVDTDASTVTLDVRPMRLREGRFGSLTMQVTGDTAWEIDGTEYAGSAGLTALAALAEDTAVVGYGAVDTDAEGFVATRVLAGSSVAWSGKDVVKGVIRARDGNTLTLGGVVLEPEAGAARFLDEISLTVGEDTTVTGYTLGDADTTQLSVGARVLALGDYSQSGFDASAGLVRMAMNQISGQVVTTQPLVLDLTTVNGRPVERFEFAGTGASAEEDADPAAYEIDTASLDTAGLDVSEWIQVRGYPAAFGGAPLDYSAVSLIDASFAGSHARFVGHWPADAGDSLSIVDGALIPGQDASRERLNVHGLPRWLTTQAEVTRIEGDDGDGHFGILVPGEGISLFRQYDDFLAELTLRLQAGGVARHLTAGGSYNEATQTLTADHVTVGF